MFSSFPHLLALVTNLSFLICFLMNDIPRYTAKLGLCYSVFLTVNSGTVLTTAVLLLCYATSQPTYNRVRPSLFVSINYSIYCDNILIMHLQEVYFTASSCILYIGASTFLGTSVHNHLYYYYHTMPGFSAYPALTACYVSTIV